MSGRPSPFRSSAAAVAMALLAACTSPAADPGSESPSITPPTPERGRDGTVPIVVGEPIDVSELEGRIVFDDFEDVFVMRADGTGIRPVADRPGPEFDGAWSPDGRRIVYRDSRRGINENDEIYVVNADGSGARNLSRSPGANEWGSDWSPDGSTIVYNSDRGGGELRAHVVAADGSDRRPVRTGVWTEYPAFSPDGRSIVFSGHADGDYDIYVADIATGDATQLTDAPGNDGWPVWSPDGSTIAFATERDDCLYAPEPDPCWTADEPGEHHDIWLMNADGSDPRRVTPEFGQFVTWSPDGRHLLISGLDLFVVRPDGSGRADVVRSGGGIPDWVA